MPGERKLCERLQVSRDTLRAALQELEREGTLGVSDRQCRRIKTKRAGLGDDAHHRVVALLSPASLQTISPRSMFVIDAVRDRLAKAGCVIECHVSRSCFSAHPARALKKLVDDHPAAVWVVVGSKEPMQRWFMRHRLPLLVIGSCKAGIGLPSFDVDHRAICRHAGDVLWRKGHRRIAIVLPQDAYEGETRSEEGLRESLRSRSDGLLRVLRHDGTTTHLCSLLDTAMRSPKPPTAYIVARAVHALTVTMHLMRRGKRIPQDVAVISRDDDPFLQSTTPDVARYSINPAQFARRVAMAARQLSETGTLAPKAFRLIPKFIAGETV